MAMRRSFVERLKGCEALAVGSEYVGFQKKLNEVGRVWRVQVVSERDGRTAGSTS